MKFIPGVWHCSACGSPLLFDMPPVLGTPGPSTVHCPNPTCVEVNIEYRLPTVELERA